MFNFKNEPSSFLTADPGGVVRRLANFLKRLAAIALACALGFTLSSSSLANAEDQQIGSRAGEQSVSPTLESTPGDGLEIGPEIIGQPVRAAANPKVNHVSIGDKTVSGTITIGAGQRKSKKLDVTIRVIVNRQAGGTEEKTVTILHTTRSQNWTVTLDSKLAEGDNVTVKQEYGGETSEGVVLEVKKSLADKHKDDLQMPSGEIWIEQTQSNIVSDDEQAEAIGMLKNVNPGFAKDFKSVKFSIEGTDHAYYEVTYTDGSTSGKIEATDLKIKTVTETSAAPTIEKVQVTDGQIIVTLAKEVAAGTKFYFVKNFTDGADKNFEEGGSCKVDKTKPEEKSQAVSVDGKKVTFPINDDDLELKRTFGIIVKEPHKLRSCAKSEPVITTPDKVAVRDPHKLTDADKKAIDKAIRDANTVNGVSKLPNSREGAVYPALIDFDKDGNARIIDPNYVKGEWDWVNYPDGKFIPEQNEDGTYEVNDGGEVIKVPAKDLVKNIAPRSPAIAVDTGKGEVTINPPAYKDPGDDTDLLSYTVTYKDADGAEKTVTATRDSGTNKWSGTGVDADTGVITLKVEDIEVGGTIKATAKDKGGLEGDTDPLDSVEATKTLETATVSYDANKGTGKMDGKKLNKGSKYKILGNAFTAPDDTQEFKAWEVDGKEVPAGTEITVTKDTTVKALWKTKPVEQKLELTVDPSEVTIVKGSPMLEPMNVEAHSTSVGGPITLQTICQPTHKGAAGTDNRGMPSGVKLVDITQDPQPPTDYKARATAKIDGNANEADVGTYRCWVYASLNGITIGPDGTVTGSGTTEAKKGVNWARVPITVHVVEFVLPKTGVLSLNYVAGYAALLIVALTGVGYLRQNRREKSTA